MTTLSHITVNIPANTLRNNPHRAHFLVQRKRAFFLGFVLQNYGQRDTEHVEVFVAAEPLEFGRVLTAIHNDRQRAALEAGRRNSTRRNRTRKRDDAGDAARIDRRGAADYEGRRPACRVICRMR